MVRRQWCKLLQAFALKKSIILILTSDKLLDTLEKQKQIVMR